jgi:hypothetical protein
MRPVAVNQNDISSDGGIFRYIPLEVLANLGLKALGLDMIKKLFDLSVIAINDSRQR